MDRLLILGWTVRFSLRVPHCSAVIKNMMNSIKLLLQKMDSLKLGKIKTHTAAISSEKLLVKTVEKKIKHFSMYERIAFFAVLVVAFPQTGFNSILRIKEDLLCSALWILVD